MSSAEEMFVLVAPDLLVRLMERTGDGNRVTVRELADVAGVHPSKVGFLRTGTHKSAPRSAALAIATRLGVDYLILWSPVGRAVPEPGHEPRRTAVAA